jgi:hypothetical protein
MFAARNTFFVSGKPPIAISYLIVAGGGGGDSGAGGGGGAGGYLTGTITLNPYGEYTITVGAGGVGGGSYPSGGYSASASGTNSSITGLTAAVGG